MAKIDPNILRAIGAARTAAGLRIASRTEDDPADAELMMRVAAKYSDKAATFVGQMLRESGRQAARSATEFRG